MSVTSVSPELRYSRTVDIEHGTDSAAFLARRIARGSKVLDLGCGPGALGQCLVRQRGCTFDGMELDPEAAKLALADYRRVVVANLETERLDAHFTERYDYIVCADVLEHLRDPDAVVAQLPALLAPNGRVLISIPNVGYAGLVGALIRGEFQYREIGLLDATHVRFFTRKSLLQWLRKNRLQVVGAETVQVPISASEFRADAFQALPPLVQRTLLAMPDALTYQFIIEAVPGEGPSPMLAEEPRIAPFVFSAQLFYRSGHDYSEAESVIAVGDVGADRQRLRFVIPPQREPLAGLRLDPADRPGCLRLFEVVLLDADGRPVWRWDPKLGFDPARCNQIHLVADDRDGAGLLLLLDGDDGWFELPVPADRLARLRAGGTLEIEVSWPAAPDALVVMERLAGLEAERAAQRNELAAIRLANESLRAQLAAEQQRGDALSAELGGARAQLAAAHVELGGVRAQLAAADAMLRQINDSITFRLGRPVFAVVNALRAAAQKAPWSGGRSRERVEPAGDGSAAPDPAPGSSQDAAPVTPQHLAFVPAGSSPPQALAPDRGRYALVDAPAGYVYVPPERPDRLRQSLAAMRRRPKFSIVVPVHDPPEELLDRAIASVEAQWYEEWELILVDDRSRTDHVRRTLDALGDPRITVLRLEENRGISGATNVGLERASGDFVVFLDHDDELTCDCLYELALRIERDDPDFLYSDEDKLTEDGRFSQPFFKPDWSPDTMMSTMYTCHVSCVRRSLALAVGGLRSEFDGAQDWDFILRVTERTTRIAHIPRVLYHWRTIPASVAADLNAKPYAIDAGKRAREAALVRRGIAGELEAVPEIPGHYRTRYHLRGQPLFSIVIPSKNNGAVLERCVDTIFGHTTYRNFEIVVMDNGSSEPDTLARLDRLARKPQVRIFRHDAPFNFSEINNIGARHARGELLVFLNDDTEVVSPDWLSVLGGYAQLDHVGAVGAKLLYPKTDLVQHAGVLNLPIGPAHAFARTHAAAPGYFGRALLEYDWIALTGACLAIERRKFEAVGGFDESFPIAYNDVELCFRFVERGLFNVLCPGVRLIHHESLSRGHDHMDEAKLARLVDERRRLYRAHPVFYLRDPFHNPSLPGNDPNFGVA